MIDPTDSELLDADDDFEDSIDEGETEDSDDDFEFEEPAVLVGIIQGHIADCKKNPQNPNKSILLEIKSENKDTRGQSFTEWYDLSKGFNCTNFQRVAAALGCEVGRKGKKWGVKGGLSALKNKEGTFVVTTYTHKKSGEIRSVLSVGEPDPKKSATWIEWLSSNPLNAAQLKAVKASCGVISKQDAGLFDSSGDTGDDV